MSRAVIALGANLGQAAQTLQTARDELARTPGVRLASQSSLYTTSPVESSGPDYINAVVVVDTTLTPLELLHVCQHIENVHGRVRPAGVINAPRTLDLDVIDFEGIRSADPVLTLPHPRMHQRLFVLVPLAEAAPEFRLADGRSASEAAEVVRRADPTQMIRKL